MPSELAQKMMEITKRKHDLAMSLIAPARGAANQMKDAGMVSGSSPLLEILFQLDALDEETTASIKEHSPEQVLTALNELLERHNG